LLPTGEVAKWLTWPISRDQWLNRFEAHNFQILQDEIDFRRLFGG